MSAQVLVVFWMLLSNFQQQQKLHKKIWKTFILEKFLNFPIIFATSLHEVCVTATQIASAAGEGPRAPTLPNSNHQSQCCKSSKEV